MLSILKRPKIEYKWFSNDKDEKQNEEKQNM